MMSSSSSNSATNGGAGNYIEHHVSKLDTLAGVAIKYGVEVVDIKRMNGLVTDLQMFALKTLRIPLPGRHPPTSNLSDGPATLGERTVAQIPPRRSRSEVLKSLESLGLGSQHRKISPAMSSLQSYYCNKTPNGNSTEQGTEMTIYKTGRADILGDIPKQLPLTETLPDRHEFRSLKNCFLPKNGELAMDMAVADSNEAEKSNEKSVRRRQKADSEIGFRTPEKNSGGSERSPVPKPKSVSQNDADISWLNPIPVGLGDSLMADGFVGMVRKSSSTSNLQDQEKNGSSSIWPTSRWSLKPDFQTLSATSISRPIFDGLPKPSSARRNKAALD